MPLSVGFRRELMHANSIGAGYLDLEGCTVIDMLPRSVSQRWVVGGDSAKTWTAI